MIFTKISLKNLYCFDNADIDLTFPRTVKDSPIEGEFLDGRPSFHFKRVCILAGANASGKTSFGKVLCGIQNYIIKRVSSNYLHDGIADETQLAEFAVEYVTPQDNRLHFLRVQFDTQNVNLVEYANIYIRKTDSNKSARQRLDAVLKNKKQLQRNTRYVLVDYSKKIEKYFPEHVKLTEIQLVPQSTLRWYYLLAETHEGNILKPDDMRLLQRGVLENILCTFDPSIQTVKEWIDEEENASHFEIIFKNADSILIDREGNITQQNRLSRGTCEAIKMAHFYSSVASNIDSTLYLDEQMAFTHSELEQAMLNLIIDKLGRYSQFFYTTHNYDILELNLPVHSYLFFKKTGEFSATVCPADDFKKNDRSLLNYVKNDAFMTLPDVGKLDDLLFED
ncbi:MAG: ATP-binding protein [Gammaproteobacteria bacterium]|nr:ATP-binding protein [Gammaproteobacteria bacterium]